MSLLLPITPVPVSSRLRRRHSMRARLALAAVLALGAAFLLTGSAFAVSPELDGVDVAVAARGEGPSPVAETSGNPRPGGGPKAPRGYDVSYPQCSGSLPSNPAFAIVGVNGGRVFSVNPCLASQIAWGGGVAAELYANTGNPGPALSSF